MNLEGMSAVKCCEEIVNGAMFAMTSENIRELIHTYGGKYYKVSNIERRLRESDKVRSCRVKGKNYVTYASVKRFGDNVNDERLGVTYD